MSYLPVGGANIPDSQIAPNLMVVVLSEQVATLELVGKFLPVIILLSIVFMFLIKLERKISTQFMINVPYENIVIKKLIQRSFLLHFLLFFSAIVLSYFVLNWLKEIIENISIYSGLNFFLFATFFASGSLLKQYFKRGFGK